VQLDPVQVAPVPASFGEIVNAVVAVTSPRSLFAASKARAVYDRDTPAAIVAVVGSMTIRSGAPAITVSVAVPLTVPLEAVIVCWPAVDDVHVVFVPVAGAQLAPPLADQVGTKSDRGFPNASLPVAVNVSLCPATMVAVFGPILMVASGPAVTVRVASAETPPLETVTV
jgi:hypothetical protein